MPKHPLLPILAAALAAYSTAGSAGTPTPGRQCLHIESDAKRLECYDKALGRKAPAPVAAVPESSAEPPGPAPLAALSRRWALERPYAVTAYKPNYVLPIAYNTRPNQRPYRAAAQGEQIEHNEVKFQISFKAKLWENILHRDMDLWFGYTQLAFWQAYNSNVSSPFRETDYEPELLLGIGTHYNLLGLKGRVLTLSLDHQSNGRSDPLSRSWNRVIAGALFERGNFAMWVRAWYRVPESASNDDNPDIEQYLGYGDIVAAYKHERQTFSVLLRNNLRRNRNRGAVELDWSFPLLGPVRGYLQYFNGYGESLIDYNHRNNRLGLGLALTDWL